MDQGYPKANGSRTATATVPLGFFAVEPGPWGAPLVPCEEPAAVFPGGSCVGNPDGDWYLVSAGPRNTVVLHPDDAPGLQLQHDPDFEDVGCCGFRGLSGTNRRCPCGAAVGTEISDCGTPYELHLDPGKVRRAAG